MQFEAYNKKIMYGTDVISVINKAAENNRLFELTNGQDENSGGYVNIVLVLNTTFVTTVKRYDKSNENPQPEEIEIKESNLDNLQEIFNTTISSDGLNPTGNALGVWVGNNKLQKNNNFTDFFEQSKEDKTKLNVPITDGHLDTNSTHYYDYYLYSALTQFKIAKFTCTNVDYDDNTGRIRELTFMQVKEKNSDSE